jgi:hypothetical protein
VCIVVILNAFLVESGRCYVLFFSLFLDFLLLDDHHFSLGFFLFGEWWLGTDQWAVGNWFLTLEASYVVRFPSRFVALNFVFSLSLENNKKKEY